MMIDRISAYHFVYGLQFGRGSSGDNELVSLVMLNACLSFLPPRPPPTSLAQQAAASAREGRVMVFNLAETAQEFLSQQATTMAAAAAAAASVASAEERAADSLNGKQV